MQALLLTKAHFRALFGMSFIFLTFLLSHTQKKQKHKVNAIYFNAKFNLAKELRNTSIPCLFYMMYLQVISHACNI